MSLFFVHLKIYTNTQLTSAEQTGRDRSETDGPAQRPVPAVGRPLAIHCCAPVPTPDYPIPLGAIPPLPDCPSVCCLYFFSVNDNQSSEEFARSPNKVLASFLSCFLLLSFYFIFGIYPFDSHLPFGFLVIPNHIHTHILIFMRVLHLRTPFPKETILSHKCCENFSPSPPRLP